MIKLTISYDSRIAANRLVRGKKGFVEIQRSSIQSVGRRATSTLKNISPRKTGAFANSWKFRTTVSGDSYDLTVQNTDEKASWIIEGTEPHLIFPKNGKALKFKSSEGGDDIFAAYVSHPGTEPNDLFEKLDRDSGFRGSVESIFENEVRRFALTL
jgi:hypothetical protein